MIDEAKLDDTLRIANMCVHRAMSLKQRPRVAYGMDASHILKEVREAMKTGDWSYVDEAVARANADLEAHIF